MGDVSACSSGGSTNQSKGVCEPPRVEEDKEARRLADEAAARRKMDAFIAAHEGGACSSNGATKRVDPGLRTPDWTSQQKMAAKTAQADRPIQSDPVGNALIGVLAGGALGAVEAAAASKAASEIVIEGTAHAVAHASLDVQVHLAEKSVENATRTAEPEDAAPSAGAPTATAATGRSGSRAVSEPAPEPNKSQAPPRVVVPYAPAMAPSVAPNASLPIRG